MNISDPLERMVAAALDEAGIEYTHESQAHHPHGADSILDFYLPRHGVSIEVKQFSSERTGRQIRGARVIVVQSREAVDFLCRALRCWV